MRDDDAPAGDAPVGDADATDAGDAPPLHGSNAPAVAVVGAQTPGNVGTIARAMKNFGMTELLLVDPPEDVWDPDGVAYGYAGHAREDVMPGAREVDLDDLVENYYTVGCTATTNEDCRSHVRFPFYTPAELPEHLAGVDADVCLVFGREDRGLDNAELERLDAVSSIPASADYPVLNLGQAATVTLYEMREATVAETQHPDRVRERASEREIERLYTEFESVLDAINHPDAKRQKTTRMFRRLLARTHPTEREVSTLTGILRRASERPERDD
ncbi:RNA methyltransferase [Halorubellus sp. JP-L1]|uniref:RNA methyltransferase n=1 Tax=Halorubellus sp. JP-L1 TaxID=2715753 RepID=UPI00140CB8D9|nr:RNA methyltransferase [Halorubellus sp. JP-L1]NHN40602.1 RNA methyltransferase [Halorubellus sp. JP-L1]